MSSCLKTYKQCFEKALRLEGSLQLSEGVNMACRTTVMNVDVDNDDEEVNLIKDVRARSNACYKCGEMGHFERDCRYDGDKPMDGQQEQDGSFDSYNPVVGKWMTNLVATTPITAKQNIPNKTKLSFSYVCLTTCLPKSLYNTEKLPDQIAVAICP